jgi:hypothetical protein
VKLKTSNLLGPALAYACALASGRLHSWIRDPALVGTSIEDIGIHDGQLWVYQSGKPGWSYVAWAPHENWDQGGPIIDSEK